MDRIQRLLGNGYFPSQLPPGFTTKDLATNHSALYTNWQALQATPKNGNTIKKAPSSKPETFSVARAGHQRRVTSLMNPIAQTFLSTILIQHWSEFLKHYRQSSFSVSRPRFLHGGGRGASIPSMQLLYERKIIQAVGYRYMLQTDISRFFPTIYTHSVPWALHGKATAKKNRQYTPKYFGNMIDLALRQGQEEQTMGLPIGPDTSHIIAEAIATSVDIELRKRLKTFPAGFRYVDDYFMFFPTINEAEAALAALIRSLKEFELQINFDKTKTCRVMEITDDYWPHRLRSFKFAKAGRKQFSDINHYFEMAKDLARRNIDENVMSYALKRASSILIRKGNWENFEAHICHVALAFPNTLQIVARIFSTYHNVGYPLDRNRIQRLINAIVQDHAPLGHHSEVAWSLWICKELQLQLSHSNIDLVSEMHSSVCALLLLDLDSSGCLVKTPKMAYWKQVETKEALFGDLWLLSYEAGIRGWGSFSDKHIQIDPYFTELFTLKVHFYDDTAKLSPLFHIKPKIMQKALEKAATEKTSFDLSTIFDLDDVDELIDYDEGDGGYEDVDLRDDDEDEGDSEDDDEREMDIEDQKI